jgi:hypothetical protein
VPCQPDARTVFILKILSTSLNIKRRKMNNIQEPDGVPEVEAEDRYSSPNKLLRIASWSYILSWVILVLDAILFIGRLVFQYMEGLDLQILTLFNLLFYLSALAGGIVWFVVLQAISEGIYLWLDIDENSKRYKKDKSFVWFSGSVFRIVY